jgi:hypothetical protein
MSSNEVTYADDDLVVVEPAAATTSATTSTSTTNTNTTTTSTSKPRMRMNRAAIKLEEFSNICYRVTSKTEAESVIAVSNFHY